jgi:hypothetical protein
MKGTIFALAFFSLTLPAFGQGVDPLIGTWKMNPAKSMAVGFELDKSSIITYTRDGQNIINNYEVINAKNQLLKGVFSQVYDGKPHASTGSPHIDDGKPHASTGSPDVNATAYTRMGSTISWVRLQNGKPVIVGQGVIDGNTYTVIQGGINASNQLFYSVYVYDRQ